MAIITLRTEKGSVLTHAEMDANFSVVRSILRSGAPEWDISAPYSIYAVAIAGGNTYMAQQANTGIDPTTDDGTNWKIVENITLDAMETKYVLRTEYTPSTILSMLSTVDGSGSGLDADTLDGIDSLQFVRSDVDDSISGIITFSNATESTTTTDGAVVVSGGVGIAKNLNVGGNLLVQGRDVLNETVAMAIALG